MGTTYSLFHVNKFPPITKKKSGSIVSLGDIHLQGKPEQTHMTFKAQNVFKRYERYEVYHEYLKHASGRTYDGQEFDTFYLKNKFDVFLDRKNNVLLCNASRKVTKSLIDTLNEQRPSQFNFDYLQVDFAAVKSKSQDVRGIWVGNMSEPFLQTAAFFGPNVEQSDSCKQAQQSGKASSYLIFYGYAEMAYPLILSAHYGVSFLRDDPEEMNFDLLQHIHKNLLTGAVTAELSQYNAKKKRQEEAVVAKAAKLSLVTTSVADDAHPPLFSTK